MSRTVKINGAVSAAPCSLTVTVDGTQVFSGEVGASADLEELIVLATLTLDNDDDTNWATKSLSIAVTQGIVKVGTMPSNIGTVADGYDFGADEANGWKQDGEGYYNPGRHSSPYGETTERTNILINGSAPDAPASNMGYDPGPTGSEHWSGWFFEVAAGEIFACTLRIPPVYTSL